VGIIIPNWNCQILRAEVTGDYTGRGASFTRTVEVFCLFETSLPKMKITSVTPPMPIQICDHFRCRLHGKSLTMTLGLKRLGLVKI
jgi:hypothetical protein